MSAVSPDRVMLGAPGSQKALSITEFLMIPTEQQLELLFRGEVNFFSGETKLRATEALKVLRKQRAASATAH